MPQAFCSRLLQSISSSEKYIAGYNGRSANKEIEQLILRHIAAFERKFGQIVLTEEDYEFIRKRNQKD